MTFLFADFLLNSQNEYNGHKTTEVKADLTPQDALDICRDLEFSEPNYIFTVEMFTCGGMTILQKDFWKTGEHPLGHTDRNILHIEGIYQ